MPPKENLERACEECIHFFACSRQCGEPMAQRSATGCECYETVKSIASARLIERLTAKNAALREKVPQWVSVEERRPEPGKRVLATDGVFVGEAYRTSADIWRRYDGTAMRDCLGSIVTHWMPLPSAPKFADILRGAPDAPEEGGKADA